MCSKARRYDLFLDDMLLAMERIEEYLTGINYASFKENHLVVDAVIRNFEIIGEASKNIPQLIKDRYPDLPWKKMYGLRNLVSHAYFTIDYEVIWEIATKNLPKDKLNLIHIIAEVKRHNL